MDDMEEFRTPPYERETEEELPEGGSGKKKKHTGRLILLFLLLCAAGAVVLYYRGYFLPGEPQTDYGVTTIHSHKDADHDGIDDQTDILLNAKAYIATKPKYESKYYETGYPDDDYGVCTDVVAFSMRDAGYDLMQLVEKDILKHPGDYDVPGPDINIDFRRVKNLLVYFRHTAIELTTDIYDTEAWQGGDIVVFEGHIGVVSDIRNENGVTYVIHHSSSKQSKYEQDILEKRDDLVAHFRISR